MNSNSNRAALKIVAIYLTIGSLWILWSDRLLDQITTSQEQVSHLQTYKGWAFVFVTGAILFILLERQFRKLGKEIQTREEAEKRVAKLNRIYRVLSNVNQSIIRDRDRSFLFQEVCRIAVEVGGYALALVGQVDWSEQSLEIVAFRSSIGGDEDSLRTTIADTFKSQTEKVAFLRQGKSQTFGNLSEAEGLEPFRAKALSLGLRSMGCFPLRTSGNTIGFMCFVSKDEDRFDDSETDLLNELSGDVGFAVEFEEGERDKQNAIETLKIAESKYRQLFEANPLPAFVFDEVTREFLAVNRAMVEKYGYSESEFRSMRIEHLRLEEDLPQLFATLEEFRANPGKRHTATRRHVTHEGTVIDVEISSHPIDYDSRPARLVLVNDITRRLNTESSLRQTTELLETLIESSPLAITQLDLGGRIQFINKAAEEMFGWTWAECVG
ncbi:MAG: PAS domain S-box protein, partial [Candidatus Omnitrophica bacterium]|nr:PAS domain S-box protein [Candidatus Omnitrophota bacterium]